jgi:phage RecT family recombinase
VSSTGIITASKTEIILPPWSNPLAEEVSKDIRTMVGYLHPAVSPVNWMAAVINELNKIEEPQKLEIGSVWETLEKLAQTSLYPGSALGHAYLVPFGKLLQLIIGYKGFLELGQGNGFIKGVAVDVVLTGETATLRRTLNGEHCSDFDHGVPMVGRKEATPETIEASYCIYETEAGFRNVVVRDKKELLALQRKASQKSPWKTGSYAPMCLKSAIRPATKLWRQTNQLATAVQADEETERQWDRVAHENPKQVDGAISIQPRNDRSVSTDDCRKLLEAWRTARTANEEPTEVVDFEVWVSQVTSMTPQSVKNPASWTRENLDKCYADLKEAASA